MLLTKEVEVRWNGNNRKHYESLGYTYPYKKDKFIVPVEHLPNNSNVNVNVQCDCCGDIMVRTWANHNSCRKKGVEDYCSVCCDIRRKQTKFERYGDENYNNRDKIEQTCLEQYGVKCALQSECIKEKIKDAKLKRYGDECYTNREKYKQTCLEYYGVENVFQLEDVKEKSKQTCLEHYGVESASQSEEVKNKIKQTNLERYGDENYVNIEQYKQTCLERYGVEHVFQLESTKQKSKQTRLERYGDENYCNVEQSKKTKLERYDDESYNNREQARQTYLERYDVEHPSQIDGFGNKVKRTKFERYGDENYNNREQMLKTKAKNGTLVNKVTFSKPHQYTYGVLCGLYGNENVELEKVLGKYSLDCELCVYGIKVDVEYNGSYWHSGNEDHDNKRKEFVLNQGYKVLNINSGCKFPTVEQIENAVSILTTTNKQVITIDLDI